MHFTKADIPPIHPQGFWSLTIYDKEYFLVANSINRYSLSSRDMFQNNPDGSMDLYIQKESPGADKQSNWLPAPNGEFIRMLSLYWPKDEAVNGAWVPPPRITDSLLHRLADGDGCYAHRSGAHPHRLP